MTNEKPLFDLNRVQKQLGKFTLDISQLDVRAGEILGLLGPTGAGKTTLLKLLAGLINADSGKITFDGIAFSPLNLPLATRRRITLVHQRPLLLNESVKFNVEYGLRLRNQRDRVDKVDAILDQVGLTQFAAQSSQSLSGGQLQLVAVARALVIEPEVLLLDEATSHLDPAHVALIEQAITQAQLARQMTVVWATHNLFQARRIANRTALLLNGQVVEVADTDDFYSNPSDSRTADFVQGRMVY